MINVEAVLFDLDGTLIDTAPDMAAALNVLLQQHRREPLPFEQIREVVSKGSIALVELGFGNSLDETSRRDLQQQFLQCYSEALCVDSSLFDGMNALLAQLDRDAIPWGIVTNKPGWLTAPLLQQLQLAERSACTVSGDDLPLRKPHPDPLLHASKQIGCNPANTVYIGDDRRDIEAGRAAGMQTLVALYGYIGNKESPRDWGADMLIDSIEALQSWLDTRIQLRQRA